jgi:aspartyl-tRNA(Asn)/glutamyl-tRNA(Gln) amidotransferase subunit A
MQLHTDLPIEDITRKIKAGELSAVELVRSHIDLAKKVQSELNAFITILEDDSLKNAQRIDDLVSKKDPSIEEMPLLGLPFTAKDLYLVKGTKTTFGSKFMEDFIAPYTSTVLQKCLDAGAILIAKTNCDPWGFGGSGENSGFGPTKHPLDKERSPGGSSSGSAASLKAGVGFFSLGTDTGGSVRQPASMCGLFGFKPTYGRNSRYGIGTMGSSFDTPGFFTRNLADIRTLEDIMQGRDKYDATTDDYKLHKQVSENAKPKIAYIKECFEDGLNEEVRQVLMGQIDKLKDKGFEVDEVSIPSVKYALSVYYILVPAEISSNRARYDGVRYGKKVSEDYDENMIKARSKFFENEVKRRIMIGTYVLSAGYADQFYKKASKVRVKLKNEFKKVFEKYNVLISPVSPTTAFKLGEKVDDPVQMYLADIYTVTSNIVGIPSLSIPVGTDSKGLPIGMQVMSEWWNDEVLYMNEYV